MKKVLFVCLLLIFMSGCGMHNADGECHHDYYTSTVAPTCVYQGYTLHICKNCKNEYRDSYINSLGHRYVEREKNYSCKTCGRAETEGFSFKLLSKSCATPCPTHEYCYAITNISLSAVENGILEFPHKYESLPVCSIGFGIFDVVRGSVTTVLIHDNIKHINAPIGNPIKAPSIKSSLKEIIFDKTCNGVVIYGNPIKRCSTLEAIRLPNNRFASFFNPYGWGGDSVETGGNTSWLFENTKYYNDNVRNIDGVQYIEDLLTTVDVNKISDSVKIQEGTHFICSGAFYRSTKLKSITIPNSIIDIGTSTFCNCVQLIKITYLGTKDELRRIGISKSTFENIPATEIICTDGNVTIESLFSK